MVDLLLGGSPCQGFSFAGKQLNFSDPRSKLFFDFVKALEELKPKYFLLENVKMKKEYKDIITQHLGVKPIEIDSALVSAQNRKRLYWTNIPNVTQPEDKKLMLKHIVEPEIDKKDFDITERMRKKKSGTLAYEKAWKNVCSLNEKSRTLLTRQDISNSGATNIKYSDSKYYKPTPIEAERLQTLPDNYTAVGVIDGKEIPISNTQRYKMIGNGWTVDVIAHILSFILETYLHTIVSLFDGISCGQVALERAGKIYNQYYASEIDKCAIAVTQKNYPRTIQLGDVTKIDWDAFLDRLNQQNENQENNIKEG
jgi:site-specific DNA-cytosine methylase